MGKTNFDLYVEEQLRDPKFRELCEIADRAWDTAMELVALREKAGLTQKQLAKKVGTTQQQISRLESPTYRRYSFQTLERVARALDADVIVSFRPRSEPASTQETAPSDNNSLAEAS
jgi:transcriptional regulator with XRE-family HTH domain